MRLSTSALPRSGSGAWGVKHADGPAAKTSIDHGAGNKRRYSRTFALDGVPAAVLDDQPKANSPPHCASSRGTSWLGLGLGLGLGVRVGVGLEG